MAYKRVVLESLACVIPDSVLRTEDIEVALDALYNQLSIPRGYIEQVTGISERRLWGTDSTASEIGIQCVNTCLQRSGVDRRQVGALINASVWRDRLEPATACSIHQALGLSADCVAFDISNACLGFMNGVLYVANMIEQGQIRAGIVVCTEGSRQVVETTLEMLAEFQNITRDTFDQLAPALTLGSGSGAALLCDSSLATQGFALLDFAWGCDSAGWRLCVSEPDIAGCGVQRVAIRTNAGSLLRHAVRLGADVFERQLQKVGWKRSDISKTVCHQVGRSQRDLMFSKFGLENTIDYTTFEFLGNTASAGIPITASLATDAGRLSGGDKLMMMGIASGLNCMLSAWECL
ncbi:3-oxoacyl-ACP synthase III [bacterium]|nr:3-oxoacyl-ACP synthase III [bacterium]